MSKQIAQVLNNFVHFEKKLFLGVSMGALKETKTIAFGIGATLGINSMAY